MSPDPGSPGTTENQTGHEGTEGASHIARSVVAKVRWAERALSPWVGRWLQRQADPEAGESAPADRYSRTAVTGTTNKLLLSRVQRVAERSTVWQPDVGSLEPAMVDRFASRVVQRFSEAGARYEPQRREASPAEAPELVLAGAPGEISLEVAEPVSPTEELEVMESEEVGPRPTMAEMRAMWESQRGHPTAPPTPEQPPRRIQRARWPSEPEEEVESAEPPGRPTMAEMRAMWESQRGHPTPPPSVPDQAPPQVQRPEGRRVARRFSQVEEISPSGKTTTHVRAPDVGPAPADEPEAPPPSEEAPSGLQPPEEPPVAEAAPPGLPVVMREAEPEPPEVPPSEEPPAAETPPVAAEVKEPRPEQPPGREPPAPPGPPTVMREMESEPTAPLSPEEGPPPISEVPPSVAEPPPGAAEEPRPGPPLVEREEPPVAEAPSAAAEPSLPSPPVVMREAELGLPEAPPPEEELPVAEAPAVAAEAPPPGPAAVMREAEPELPEAPPPEEESPVAEAPAAAAEPELPEAPPPEEEPSLEAPAVAAEAPPTGPPDIMREAEPELPEAPPPEEEPLAAEVPSVAAEAPAPGPPVVMREVEPELSEGPPLEEEPPLAEIPSVAAEAPPLSPPAVMREAEPELSEAPPPEEVPPVVIEAGPPSPPVVMREEVTELPKAPSPEQEPPVAEAEAPGPPVIQRQVAPEPPPEAAEAQAPPAEEAPPSREVPAPAPRPAVAEPLTEPPAGLEEEVLARAQARAHLPLTEPLRPARGVEPELEEERVEAAEDLRRPLPPTQVAMPRPPQVQARFGEEGAVGVVRTGRPEVPLPLAPQPPAGELVQREPLAISMDLAPPLRRVEVVQRDVAVEEEEETSITEAPGVEEPKANLDDLARQIYPIIKRMLAVERERWFSR
jgi:hypothetical protein